MIITYSLVNPSLPENSKTPIFLLKESYLSNFIILKSHQNLNSFMTGGRYHIEISPLICYGNQWTGSYMITAPVMKELSIVV